MKAEDEKAWAKAMALALGVYQATRTMSKEACGGLARLMQQEAVSIPVHLAAGAGARALACLTALDRELELAGECGCLPPGEKGRLQENILELSGLIKKQ